MIDLNNPAIEKFTLPLLGGILAAFLGWLVNQLPAIKQSPTTSIARFGITIKLIVEAITLSIILNSISEILPIPTKCQATEQLQLISFYLIGITCILLLLIFLDIAHLLGSQGRLVTFSLLVGSIALIIFITHQLAVPIISEVGAESELRKVESFLKRGEWKAADVQMQEAILWISRRNTVGFVPQRSWDGFPCKDLNTMDRLWQHYSNNRFGFTAQKRVWEEVGEDIDQFGDRLEWRVNGNWIFDSDNVGIINSIRAPEGHFPVTYLKLDGKLFGENLGLVPRLGQCETKCTASN